MILGFLRAVWLVLVLLVLTVTLGLVVAFAALLGVRGTIYSRLSQSWARGALWASGCTVVVHGEENVPRDRPAIVAANHVSWFDIFALASVVRIPFYFVAKKELEYVPLFGWAWRIAGHISIDRSNRDKAVRSLRRAGEKVRADNGVVVIYPEGTRSRSGRLQPFKKGAFMLAKETGLPIVPAVVTGSFQIMKPDTFVIRPATIHLWYEPPVGTGEMTERDVEPVMRRVRDAMVARLLAAGEPPPIEADLPAG